MSVKIYRKIAVVVWSRAIRIMQNIRLRIFWISKANRKLEKEYKTELGLNRCKIVYINLRERVDRRKDVETELSGLCLEKAPLRFDAIRHSVGAVGCASSHLQVIQQWREQESELLMVCEDDIQFLCARKVIDEVIDDFANDPSLAVLCLGYNARNAIKIQKNMLISSDTQTTSCYIIKWLAKPHLMEAAENSIKSFDSNQRGVPIDKMWKTYQKRVPFALACPRVVFQRPSYSDIEAKFVNYKI